MREDFRQCKRGVVAGDPYPVFVPDASSSAGMDVALDHVRQRRSAGALLANAHSYQLRSTQVAEGMEMRAHGLRRIPHDAGLQGHGEVLAAHVLHDLPVGVKSRYNSWGVCQLLNGPNDCRHIFVRQRFALRVWAKSFMGGVPLDIVPAHGLLGEPAQLGHGLQLCLVLHDHAQATSEFAEHGLDQVHSHGSLQLLRIVLFERSPAFLRLVKAR